MGRPRKSEPRRNQLNLSLTDGEFNNIKFRARAVGMRPVPFSRAILLADRRGIVRDGTTATNRDQLIYGQLVRLGNNLNQMVRHLHRTGDPLPPDLEPLLNDIRQIIARGVAP